MVNAACHQRSRVSTMQILMTSKYILKNWTKRYAYSSAELFWHDRFGSSWLWQNQPLITRSLALRTSISPQCTSKTKKVCRSRHCEQFSGKLFSVIPSGPSFLDPTNQQRPNSIVGYCARLVSGRSSVRIRVRPVFFFYLCLSGCSVAPCWNKRHFVIYHICYYLRIFRNLELGWHPFC